MCSVDNHDSSVPFSYSSYLVFFLGLHACDAFEELVTLHPFVTSPIPAIRSLRCTSVAVIFLTLQSDDWKALRGSLRVQWDVEK